MTTPDTVAIARQIVAGERPELRYIADDTVKRFVCCGTAVGRSPGHDVMHCLMEGMDAAGEPGLAAALADVVERDQQAQKPR